jgi:hypothetical protein
MRISRYVAGIATLGLAALAAIAPVKPAAAQGFQFSSSFQVQNLSTTAANISIAFYDLGGTSAAVSVDDSIPGSGQKTYATLPSAVQAGFNGSAVISSDQRVAAIVNINSPSLSQLTFGGEAYVGVTEGSQTASLPLLFKGSFGFNSFFNVQNVGQTATNVTVTYAGGGLSAPVVKPAQQVAPGAAVRFDVGGDAGLPAGFNGSATITSSASEIAAVATHVGPSTVLIYNSFAAGSQAPVFPLVNANNSGYITGIAVQNRGATASNVTMSYTPSLAGTACTETKSVPAGGSAFFAIEAFATTDPTPSEDNCANGATFIGSARVTANSANVELVGTVDQVNSAARKGGTYTGFNPADATNTVVYPLINDRNFGFFTGLSMVNTSNVATTIECVYSGTPVRQSASVPAGGTFTPVQVNQIANGYNGSGVCTSSAAGATIVGIGQQLRPTGTASTFYVYEGTNSN